MEVFNKLYSSMSSSVSSTVSQLSGVLPGNPVTREFEASEHVASAGPGMFNYSPATCSANFHLHFIQLISYTVTNNTTPPLSRTPLEDLPGL